MLPHSLTNRDAGFVFIVGVMFTADLFIDELQRPIHRACRKNRNLAVGQVPVS